MLGFVARQPIFDDRGRLSAYELLFREGPENYFGGDPEHASRSVIHDSLEIFKFDELTGGRRAFVNITRQVLVDGLFRRLPPEHTVLELLETVEADDQVVAACKAAKEAGYLIALDDFAFGSAFEPLLPYTDFVKIDFLATTPEERTAGLEWLGQRPLRLLAEKIETRTQYDEARRSGFSYFQGFFFQRPEMLSADGIEPQKRAALRLVGELHDISIPLDGLGALARSESQLVDRLLADLNGAVSGPHRIHTINDARQLLGESAFRRWAARVALATLGDDRPAEFMVTALVRAHFAESVARAAYLDEPSLFLAGMLSASDSVLGRPLREVLACLEPPRDTQAALSMPSSRPGLVLELVLAYERGEWNRVLVLADQLEIDEDVLPDCFRDAVSWANAVYPH